MSRALSGASGDQRVHDAGVIEEAARRILSLAESVGEHGDQIPGSKFAGADFGVDVGKQAEHRRTPIKTLDRTVGPDQHRMDMPGVQVVEPAGRGFKPGQDGGHVAVVFRVPVEMVIQFFRGAGDSGPDRAGRKRRSDA